MSIELRPDVSLFLLPVRYGAHWWQLHQVPWLEQIPLIVYNYRAQLVAFSFLSDLHFRSYPISCKAAKKWYGKKLYDKARCRN